MDQLHLHLISIAIAWICRKFAHFDDGTRQVPTQMQDALPKTLQIEQAQAKPLNATLQKLTSRPLGQRAQPDSIFIVPIQAPGISDVTLRVTLRTQIDR